MGQMDKEIAVEASPAAHSGTGSPQPIHGSPEVIQQFDHRIDAAHDTLEQTGKQKGGKLAYLKTKEFYAVLILGQALALCITGTNTFTSLLVEEGTSIPAFQTFFNYVLLNITYTSYTIYKYGFKGYCKFLLKDGWKCESLPSSSRPATIRILTLPSEDIILSFLDVEGNYFTVLAYRYTTILSAQLINFWAIVIVVFISFFFLKVRYHYAQIGGIFVCIAGMGLLLASDHITGSNGGDISKGNQLKGDLFALVGATVYGLSNVAEEYLVSTRPLYEVVGQLGFWGMIINGAQAGIFDRHSFKIATWNGKVGGYLVGYTLLLTIFYSFAPVLFRLASAAFFNVSLLTGNFWGVSNSISSLFVFNC